MYEIVLDTLPARLKLRKHLLSNKATLISSLNKCTLELKELIEPNSEIQLMKRSEYFKECEQITDHEGLWRKFQRWLIGLHWRDLAITESQ